VGTRFDFRSDDETCTTPDTGIQGSQSGARQRDDATEEEVEPGDSPALQAPERLRIASREGKIPGTPIRLRDFRTVYFHALTINTQFLMHSFRRF
jgi:hypothetical protein